MRIHSKKFVFNGAKNDPIIPRNVVNRIYDSAVKVAENTDLRANSPQEFAYVFDQICALLNSYPNFSRILAIHEKILSSVHSNNRSLRRKFRYSMIQPIIHIILHFIVPGFVAKFAFPNRWKSAWLVMVLTIVVDLDHLLADPIYDPDRCSIGYHPLHTYPVLWVYLTLALIPKTRLSGLGLLIHMALDGVDCIWMMVD